MSEPLNREDVNSANVIAYDGPLWRMFQTRGRHRVAWDQFRHHKGMNTAADALTPFAEIFRRSRVIDPSVGSGWCLAGWTPTRQLTLVDLAERNVVLPATLAETEALAGLIEGRENTELDGIMSRSASGREPVITVFHRSTETFPEAPQFQRALAEMPSVVSTAAARLGFGIRPY